MIGAKATLTADKLARLQTVAEMGMARAGQGLSDMMGRSIEVVAPRVAMVPLEQVPQLAGGPDTTIVGIYLSILGDLTGHIILMVPLPSALALVDTLLEQPAGTTEYLDAMAESALAEVGNLTGSFFLAALADSTGLRPHPSPPAVAVDMIGAILDAVLADLGQEGEDGFMIETTFRQSERAISGFFLVFPDRVSLEAIIRTLRN